jgi:3-hydroxybutyryl-CoA dehydrogenase
LAVSKIAVLGAGLMGHGIAQVAAQFAKTEVYLTDSKQEFLDRGVKMIESSLERFVKKGDLPADESANIRSRIHPVISLGDALRDVDLVIEAVPEEIALKRRLLSEVEKKTREDTIIASNTSSLSITMLAKATKRPEKFCGMHFFNPPQLMKLVEVVRGAKTSDDTVQVVKELAESMGKDPVVVKKDAPGFIVNRILVPALNEAIALVQEGVADPADIDKAIKLGLNWPMGPLALSDHIGLDTVLAMSKVVSKATKKRARSTNLLNKMIKSGTLGRKTGKGFFDWPEKR